MVKIPRVTKDPPSETVILNYTLTEQDYRASGRKPFLPLSFLPFAAIIWMFILTLIWLLGPSSDGPESWTSVFAISVASILMAWLAARISYEFANGFLDGYWISFLEARKILDVPTRMRIDRDGLEFSREGTTELVRWTDLSDIAEDANRYYFKSSKRYDNILPKRAFVEDKQNAVFVRHLTENTRFIFDATVVREI